MTQKNVFTKDDLKILGESHFARAERAIDAGDKEMAKRELEAIHEESMLAHDILRDWLSDVLSEVGRRFGDDSLHEILLKTVKNYLVPLKGLFQKSFKDAVEATAAIWRGHFSAFEVREDDEKVTFVLDPCGSGGRQITQGKYEAPLNLLRISDAQVMTGHSEDCPVYCAHCMTMTEIMLDEDMGCVFVVDIEDGKCDGKHLFHVYKNVKSLPVSIYSNLGRTKKH